MNPSDAVDFGREAVMTGLTLAAPILIVGVLAAILIGIAQSLTQIQDQTVSFVPKIILIALTFVFCLPWLTDRFVGYSKSMLEKPHFIVPKAPDPAPPIGAQRLSVPLNTQRIPERP